MSEVDNSQDILDSRDVIARIEELRESLEQLRDWLSDPREAESVSFIEAEVDEAAEELRILEEFTSELEDYLPDWKYGESLIRDSYFETYAQELAEDIGSISSNADWPLSYIDWERAADALKMDYTSSEFDGVTYWGRM